MDDELKARCSAGDLHPTGPLWGRGESRVAGEVRELEQRVADQHAELAQGLEVAGLESARRALCLPVRDLTWENAGENALTLEFFLPAGAYATAVVRELVQMRDTDDGGHHADEA